MKTPELESIGPIDASQIGWPLLLTTLATLLLELAFARLFSAVFFYHYAFLVISMALLGLSVGAVVSKLASRIRGGSFRTTMSLLCAAAAFSLLPALHTTLGASIWLVTDWQAFAKLAHVFLVCMIPFVFAGAAITSAVSRGSRQIAKLYSFDLLGASLGCLLFVPAVNLLGAPNVVLLAAIVWLAASIAWLIGTQAKVLAGCGYLAITTFTALLLVNLDGRLFDVRVSHGAPRTNEIFSAWNAFSRVNVQKRPDNTLWIEIDGGAGTWMPEIDFEGISGKAFLAWQGKTGPDLAFLMAKQPKVLIIGAGGGVDVARAIAAGSKDVTAVEINPLIAETIMSDVFRRETRGLYHRPEVRLHVEDGRTFAQRSTDHYDVIQLAQVGTWAASASGAYALTENYLYTVDAVRAYFGRLATDGKLSISRWEFRRPRETVRLAAIMQEALRLEGVARPERHLVVVIEDLPDYPQGNVRMGTVILQKDPFTRAALDALQERMAGTKMKYAYAPGVVAREPFDQLFDATRRERLFAEYDYDVTPVTDDRPFFFFTGRWNQAFEKLFAFDDSGDSVNTGAQFLLLALFIMTAIAVVILFLVPLWLAARRPQPRAREWPFLVYALAIGVGFVAMEMGLIQRFIILLGNPVYSLTVAVFSLLLGGSLGSRLSGRIPDSRLLARSRQLLLGVAGVAALYAYALPPLASALQSMPVAVKIVATVALIFPLAVLMGMPFAIALRMVSRSGTRLFEWVWALNAAATVMGSVLAILVAVIGGITMVFVMSALLYASGVWLLPRMVRGQAVDSESRAYAPDSDMAMMGSRGAE